MAAVHVVHFTVLEVVDVETGLWCNRCALSSAALVTLASQVGQGPLRLSRGVRCLDGHGWLSSGCV